MFVKSSLRAKIEKKVKKRAYMVEKRQVVLNRRRDFAGPVFATIDASSYFSKFWGEGPEKTQKSYVYS